MVNPLASTRQLRGIVTKVVPETTDSATIHFRPGKGWNAHEAGQWARIGVEIDGVRQWRVETFDRDMSVENVRVEIDDLIEAPDGETVVMALRVLVRLKRFELDHEMPWAAVWIIRHGKLVWAQGYVHRADALEAAGLRE